MKSEGFQPLPLSSGDEVLHWLIDLKSYQEMLVPANWHELGIETRRRRPLPYLVSTEFLDGTEAARRMNHFSRSLKGLDADLPGCRDFLWAAACFRRWNCLEILLETLMKQSPNTYMNVPDAVLTRTAFDAIEGGEGCADGHIVSV
jgi:hypothetical protein